MFCFLELLGAFDFAGFPGVVGVLGVLGFLGFLGVLCFLEVLVVFGLFCVLELLGVVGVFGFVCFLGVLGIVCFLGFLGLLGLLGLLCIFGRLESHKDRVYCKLGCATKPCYGAGSCKLAFLYIFLRHGVSICRDAAFDASAVEVVWDDEQHS